MWKKIAAKGSVVEAQGRSHFFIDTLAPKQKTTELHLEHLPHMSFIEASVQLLFLKTIRLEDVAQHLQAIFSQSSSALSKRAAAMLPAFKVR